MNRNIIPIVALILIAIVGYLIYNNTTNTDVAENNTFPLETPIENIPTSEAEVKEFTITGANYRYNPSQITVNQNDRVQITFVNSGGTHDFKLDEFNVATKILQDGQEEVVTFTADKKGNFEYYCSVGTHRQMGMVGKLIVE